MIDSIGGEILSAALPTLAAGGSLTTLGYSGGRKATIDVTDLIWKPTIKKPRAVCSAPRGLGGSLEYHRPAASIRRNQANRS